jgi:uncharacterized protein (DUF3084 family)
MKEQDIPKLFEIMKKNPDITYKEATKVQEDIRLRNEASAALVKEAGVCITSGMKRDKDAMEKMKKDREVKRVPLTESRQKQEELEPIENEYDYHKYWKDMYEKEHKLRQEVEGRLKELQIRLAEALEISEAHQKQMGKLQTRLTEVEEDNKKLAHQIEDIRLNGVRKAGL